MRQKIQERAVKDEARFKARKDVVDAMWKQKRRVETDRTLTTTAAGAAKLEELKREVGYTTEPSAPAPTPGREALEELKAEVGYPSAGDAGASGGASAS